MGWITVITDEGNEMLGQLAGGEHTLTLTKAAAGSGYVAQENMRSQTALQAEKMDAAIVRREYLDNGVKLRLRISPATETVGSFTAHEIGVWGKLDSGSAKLIMLCQDEETGVYVPTVSESPEYAFDLFAAIGTSNTDSLVVNVNPSVYVTNSQLDDVANEIRNSIAPVIYPVGSIYMSVNNVDPAVLFGGRWEAISGKFLLSSDSNHALGTTGGEETVTLSSDQMPRHTHTGPSHYHTIPAHSHGLGGHAHGIPTLYGTAKSNGAHSHQLKGYNAVDNYNPKVNVASWANYDDAGGTYTRSSGDHTHNVEIRSSTTESGGSGSTQDRAAFNTQYSGTGNTGEAGRGTAHNNMPPYLVVNVWKRVE